MKVVINKCYGGFGLSQKAYEKLIEWGIPVREYQTTTDITEFGEVIFDISTTSDTRPRYWEVWTYTNRTHPLLVRVVEELGEEANDTFSKLKIVEIPDDIDWYIDKYDGIEHIAEKHRTWG